MEAWMHIGKGTKWCNSNFWDKLIAIVSWLLMVLTCVQSHYSLLITLCYFALSYINIEGSNLPNLCLELSSVLITACFTFPYLVSSSLCLFADCLTTCLPQVSESWQAECLSIFFVATECFTNFVFYFMIYLIQLFNLTLVALFICVQ